MILNGHAGSVNEPHEPKAPDGEDATPRAKELVIMAASRPRMRPPLNCLRIGLHVHSTPEYAAALPAALSAEVEGEVRFDHVSRALYATDASVYQIMPRGVVIPRTRDDVRRTVRICREHGVSITARGGGTSQAGQAIGAGVQLDFSKYLNRVLELNPAGPSVRVEPGIVLDELNAFLEPYGLQLPLDLSTSNRATIGGMIANNSAGTRSVIYGKTIDYVRELTCILAEGSQAHFRELSEEDWNAACGKAVWEGRCYRAVSKLAAEHRDEVQRRFPKILRRVGGYNLDEFIFSDRPKNLARLLVGSEGTLALAVEAKLRLVPLPRARAVCVVQFDDFLDALAAAPAILAHGPSAVELVDRFILNTTRGKREFEPLRDFIVGDPAAVLIVEFLGNEADEPARRIASLIAGLRQRGQGGHFHLATDRDAQARIWRLRRAALGLSMSQRGDAKAISFVEDTAVAPERLRDYIERFQAILARHETPAGFYAHASVGLLHIRPVVNLKTAEGVSKFQRVADEIADLVLEFGGALSGEHGDGLVRSPFQERMFGPALYGAFREIKHAFDPQGLFNPGKIVDAPGLTKNLRFGPDYETREVATAFDFSDFGGVARAAEQCGGVGACRKTRGGTMCPSYMATREEADSTRGRANALRLAIAGELGPAGLASAELLPVLELCLECKACKSECPTGVDLARLKSEFLYQYHQQHGVSFRTRLLAHVERWARWGCRLAPLSNWLVRNRISRRLNDWLLGLDRRRPLPAFARRTFLDWWRKSARGQPPATDDVLPQVALFADTFTNYFEPQHAIAAVRVAEHLGFQPVVPQRVCCGRPLISKGFLKQAARQAAATTRTLLPWAERGVPIVFCEPSCYSAVCDDHTHLVDAAERAQAEMVASACVTFEEWAWSATSSSPPARLVGNNGDDPDVLLHAHCHQKALVGTAPAVKLLSACSTKTIDLDAGCCGMAGSFGYEREHYEVSHGVGERKLFPAIREKPPGSVVVASGFSCRQQIHHFTSVQPVSSAMLLASLLEVDAAEGRQGT